jgi:hypothetical protein
MVISATSGIARQGKIFLANSPEPHYTISEEAMRDGYHIYEVEPIGRIVYGEFEDAWCLSIRIARYIGNARGIAKHKKTAGVRRHDVAAANKRSGYKMAIRRSMWLGGR